MLDLVLIPRWMLKPDPCITPGQIKPTDVLVDMQQFAQPGTITAFLEPIYEGQLHRLPQGGNCFASHHEAIQHPAIGFLMRFGLHAIDTVGIVHAMVSCSRCCCRDRRRY
ncbi:hypothetical protein [Thiohalocapsa sp. ML1]|jgi:hypothetical protein|uniref:hypothetical protein n=1 Tax=Thiohalocapsa sp. ML1 TaxID=1431688 RepID=UPI000732048B|nr:hypothetical protein [Thiohalocapsa sp. ML1]